MVGRWGMSQRIGPVSVLPREGDPRMQGVSDALLDAVDTEVRRVVEECYARAVTLLREHRNRLDSIVERLLEHETLDEPEIYAAAGLPRPVPQSTAAAPELQQHLPQPLCWPHGG
jgi:cell division protease FtsH